LVGISYAGCASRKAENVDCMSSRSRRTIYPVDNEVSVYSG